MKREEIRDLLKMLMEFYPYYKSKVSDAKAMLDLWELFLGEYDAKDVYMAARLHMETNTFFPAVADIKDKMHRAKIIYDDVPTAPDRLIDASKTNYIEDLTAYDDLLDLDPDAEHCEKCPRKAYCYNKTT